MKKSEEAREYCSIITYSNMPFFSFVPSFTNYKSSKCLNNFPRKKCRSAKVCEHFKIALTSASERSEKISSCEPFLTASSAASQSLSNAFSKEPSTPLVISKKVGNTCGFKRGSFNNDSRSPSFNTGLGNIT